MLVCELDRDWVAGAREIWADLAQRSDANSIFTSWAWVSSWLETVGSKANAKILGIYDGNLLVGLLPLVGERTGKNLWTLRLSLAGVEETGADYNDILCARGFEDAVSQAAVDWLERCCGWTLCEFSDVLSRANIGRVARLMEGRDIVEDAPGSICPRMSLNKGWQNFLAERFDRKRRYNIERQLRLAEEKQKLRLSFYDKPETISEAFRILVKLHDDRKAEQGIKSAFTRSRLIEFHEKTAVRLSDSGSAFIATLEFENEALAAAYCFRDSYSIYYYQTGLSKSGASCGAGSTLLYMLLRWAAEEGYQWFDFLKGEENYKKSWATDLVQQQRIRIFRSSLLGWMQVFLVRTHKIARHLHQKFMKKQAA